MESVTGCVKPARWQHSPVVAGFNLYWTHDFGQLRKHFSSTFRAQVVHELLKEEQSIAQQAAKYSVHPTQLDTWKARALHGLPSLFEERAAARL